MDNLNFSVKIMSKVGAEAAVLHAFLFANNKEFEFAHKAKDIPGLPGYDQAKIQGLLYILNCSGFVDIAPRKKSINVQLKGDMQEFYPLNSSPSSVRNVITTKEEVRPALSIEDNTDITLETKVEKYMESDMYADLQAEDIDPQLFNLEILQWKNVFLANPEKNKKWDLKRALLGFIHKSKKFTSLYDNAEVLASETSKRKFQYRPTLLSTGGLSKNNDNGRLISG